MFLNLYVKLSLFWNKVKFRKLAKSLRKPAIRINTDNNQTTSRFNGEPLMPDNIDWPMANGKPLEFICQIKLDELPKGLIHPSMPKTGNLYFFYYMPEPNYDTDEDVDLDYYGDWKLIYSEAPLSECKPRQMPSGLDKTNDFKFKYLKFEKIITYPSSDDMRFPASKDLELMEQIYLSQLNSSEDDPYNGNHQMFGYLSQVQDPNIGLNIDLDEKGISFDDYQAMSDDEKFRIEMESLENWVLLLQLDSDHDVGFDWMYCFGMLYILIRKEDLKNLNFDNAHLEIQFT